MTINRAIKLVEMFGQKMAIQELTEYEVLLYEAACRFLERYFNLQRIHVDKEIAEYEQETSSDSG